ncbi:MAG: hypothetical protein NTY61_02010 [Candidatus Parcubacteria bacterium]|nr:hypothetical protein [Candidatus Parcubacteria bacterium]
MFKEKFGSKAKYKVVIPSRVVLIGEHSDYYENYILAMGAGNITMDSYITPRDDNKIRILSRNLKSNDHAYFEFSTLTDRVKFQWIQYVQGAVAMYAEEFTRKALKGFDMLIDSKIPIGGGLSSSSTLTMTSLAALGLANGFTDGDQKIESGDAIKIIDNKGDDAETHKFLRKLCMMGCWSEYWYGTRGGAMDHFTTTVSRKGFATLLDNRPYTYEYVPIPSEIAVIVCNTMVSHNQLFNQYAKRKESAWNGLSKLEKYYPEAKNIRDITLEQLEEHRGELADEEYRRIKHPITEKTRLFEFVEAFKSADFKRAGELLNQTHQSLDHDYEVTCVELNIMQSEAAKIDGCYGARMIGGGFGGCVVAIVDKDKKESFIETIKQNYDSNLEIKSQNIKSEVWEAVSGDGLKIEVIN